MPTWGAVTSDGAGGIHLVFHFMPGGIGNGPQLAYYTYWNGEGWRDPVQLFGATRVSWSMGLARDAAGTFHLALAGEINGVRGIHYVTGRAGGR